MASAAKTAEFRNRWLEKLSDLESDTQALENTNNTDTTTTQRLCSQLQSTAAQLSKELDEAADYLAPYDQRQYSEKHRILHDRILSLSKQLKKKTFSFAKRGNRSQQEPIAEKTTTTSQTPINFDHLTKEPEYAITGLNHKKHTLKSSEFESEERSKPRISISNCECSVINLVPSSSSSSSRKAKNLFILNLRKCIVLAPFIPASIFINECIDCVFIISSQQLRIHSSHNCDFYSSSTSAPIIETCSELSFSVYPLDPSTPQTQHSVVDFDNPSSTSSCTSTHPPIDTSVLEELLVESQDCTDLDRLLSSLSPQIRKQRQQQQST